VTVKFTGELTIAHAAALHKELLQAVAQGLEIRLDLAHAVYLDAAILQLICAMRRTAVATSVEFALYHVQQCVIASAQVFGMESVLMDRTSAGER
jgi:anti-anti-sigma factor